MPLWCAAVEGLSDCDAIVSAWVSASGPRLEPLGEHGALDQFEDEGTHTVAIFDPINRADVRMIQRREPPRLAIEAGAPLGAPSQTDLAHPAFPE